MSEELLEAVYSVAVSVGPVEWVVRCEICNEEFGEPTTDEELLDKLEAEHRAVHGLSL